MSDEAPSLKAKEWLALEQKVALPLYPRQPILFTKGKGCILQDHRGKKYLDFLTGIAVLPLGHSHPRITAAIRDQAGKLAHTSNLYYTLPYIKAARLLHKLTRRRAFFCNSGAEAIEALLKFARKWGRPQGKYCLVVEEGSFHGRTMGALSLTGQEKFQTAFQPLLPGVVRVPFEDFPALEKAITQETAALLLEPILGEKGVYPHSKEFLKKASELCQKKGVLFLLDEVQTGVGRTGHWFAYQHYGIEPDGIALAKGLGGGLPLGCALVNEKVASSLAVGDHASTFGGNPIATRACHALLDTMLREKTLQHVQKVALVLKEALRALQEETRAFQEIRQVGLMVGLTLKKPLARQLVERALHNGLITHAPSERDLRLLPPLIIQKKQIREALELLKKSWTEVTHGN